MKIGDLVKHNNGTIHGIGLVLDFVTVGGGKKYVDLMWHSHGQITFRAMSNQHLEKINHERN